MGWKNAVGICQANLRELLLQKEPRGAGLPAAAELRKDRALPTNTVHRVLSWHQAYIDNFDTGVVIQADPGNRETTSTLGRLAQDELSDNVLPDGRVARSTLGRPAQDELSDKVVPDYRAARSTPGCPTQDELSKQWQQQVQAGYERADVPRAADKGTYGLQGSTLGVELEGEQGVGTLSSQMKTDMIELTWYILNQPVVKRKELAMCIGRWIFAFQLRRPCKVCLQQVFQVINGNVHPSVTHAAVEDELVCAMCLLPLCYIDFCAQTVDMVTCSDASETGGGVCYSSTLTDYGLTKLNEASRGTGEGRVPEPALVESFGGISGSRRALDLLGITPALHLHSETNPEACRVTTSQYPDSHSLGDLQEISHKQLVDTCAKVPRVDIVIDTAGPPCQDVSSLKAERVGVQGPSSKPVHELPQFRELVKSVFPGAKHLQVTEMVASLDSTDQATYDTLCQSKPYLICASDISHCRRKRFY